MFSIDVTPGVVWVEVPEVDLKILCGCPADTVKHLMRRGLIRPTKVKGVPCEIGPNVILLSDVMIQGGDFSNLAEFPILQMFYRQGSLLPGHPNNTGQRPILIGRRDQVDAQIQYIYRGNYGLISHEEITATGVSAEDAHEMMRIKTRFAFGRIQHPSELLDRMVLDAEPIEIKSGVTVRRTALNVFEFTYGDETLSVDLNLPPFHTYESPYPLGATHFRREYFAVVHSGEGDGWDIKRPSMNAVLVYQGKVYLIDAGPNLVHILRALGIGINEVEGIFHTHSHDDHFAGLTALMQSDRRIKYYSVPLVRAAVEKKLSALLSTEENAFEDYFEVCDLTMGQWNNLNGLDVKPVFSPHPVETTVLYFRAVAEGGYKSYAHFADVVGLETLKGMITDDDQKPGINRIWYDTVVKSYREPATIKKVDIGGGLIHGSATDFIDDSSEKIILAHTALPLTLDQKRIGSGASFGSMDVLIPSHRDFLGRAAFNFLSAYFPSVSKDELGALLNRPVSTFNPETILIRGGQHTGSIYLLLTGQVEALDEETEFRAELSAGALLGEMSGLHGLPSAETYRAISYIQVLEITCDLYSTFVQRHHLFESISTLLEGREFLSKTQLLGSVVSTGTLNEIVADMRPLHLQPGKILGRNEKFVGLIHSGTIVRILGGEVLETLGPGDFFGEELAIFGVPTIASLRAETNTVIYRISPSLLARIPKVRWKMFEAFERRTQLESSASSQGRTILKWQQDYSVNIRQIDTQHIRLFNTANTLLDAFENNHGTDEVMAALDFLINYAHYHFAEEEALLLRYNYPEERPHSHSHKTLITQAEDLKAMMTSGKDMKVQELLDFLYDWIVNHIQSDDRKYATFLNAQGVF